MSTILRAHMGTSVEQPQGDQQSLRQADVSEHIRIYPLQPLKSQRTFHAKRVEELAGLIHPRSEQQIWIEYFEGVFTAADGLWMGEALCRCPSVAGVP